MRLSMSLTGIFAAIFASILSSFYGAEQSVSSIKPIEHKQCSAIVWDLGGVVFDTSKHQTVWEIGPKLLISFWLSSKNSKDFSQLKKRYFEMLNFITKSDGNPWNIKDGDGNELPQLMAEWMRGMRSNKEILQQIDQFTQLNKKWFNSPSERRVLRNIARITFDPRLLNKTRTLYTEAVDLIQECKQRGFKLYILSNWDRESSKLMVNKYPHVFELFDGIIFSGDIGHAKPEPEIFKTLTDIIPAQECVFIDDQEENIQAARTVGFNTIQVCYDKKMLGSKPNFQLVKEQLDHIKSPLMPVAEETSYA